MKEFSDKSFACLAIESSQPGCSVAAVAGGRVALREYTAPGEQSRRVYASVREVLDEVGCELSELDCIAFGCGPGGFTGLRIGAAVAQALAYGSGLPVARISSLAAMAAGALDASDAPRIAACVDARMNEAYLGLFRRCADGGVAAEQADCLVDPTDYRLPDGDGIFAIGGAWLAFPELRENNAAHIVAEDAARIPSAESLLTLAAQEFRAGRTVAATEAVPNYVRDKVTS